MRLVGTAVLCVLLAGTASGQILYLGAGAGTSWQYQSPIPPEKDWRHQSDAALTAFVALPLQEDTLFRLRYVDVPHDTFVDPDVWEGSLRGLTVGVDYLLQGVLGEALVSGGVGAYRLTIDGVDPPGGGEDTKFGWYVGVGEWFTLSRRSRLSIELSYNRASLYGSPQVVLVTAGLTFGF